MAVLDLTTLARVETYAAGFGGAAAGAAEIAAISQLITQESARIETHCCRLFLEVARTKYFRVAPGQRVFPLPAFPLAATPALEVRGDVARVFGTDTIVDSGSYFCDPDTAVLEFDRYQPLPGPGTLKVTWTGGLAASTAALIAAHPDLASACEEQVRYVLQRRNNVGGSLVSGGGGSTSFQKELDLLDDVKSKIERYVRRHHG